MTELATGTDAARDPDLLPDGGTSPTPTFEGTAVKVGLSDIRSIARCNNRMQREEILAAQKFLREWCSVRHAPRIRADAREAIQALEEAPAGTAFDRAFLRIFSYHQYQASMRSLNCLVGRKLRHDELRCHCSSIVILQVNDIDEMRHLLCAEHSECDFLAQRNPLRYKVTAAD